MDNPQHPDPSQELPPPPEEKLLRPPTFWEKYGKMVTWLIVILSIAIAGYSGWVIYNSSQQAQTHSAVMTSTPSESPAPTEILPSVFDGRAPEEVASDSPAISPTLQVCSQEVKVCPDGSYVGRSGPTCEFTACP